jgi:hypothetical protein
MENIFDIYSINKATILPLALGYKLLIILVILILLSFIIFRYNNKFISLFSKKKCWKKNFKEELDNLTLYTNKIDTDKLYVIIKQIIIKIHGRKTVAALSGVELLLFLQKKDPNNFAWPKHGLCLVNSFAPRNQNLVKNDDVNNLIKAIKKWL